MTPHSTSREPGRVNSAPGAAGPVFTARDGAVFRRGIYMAPDECGRLLDYLRGHQGSEPWHRALNARLIAQLEAAMAEAYHMEIAA